jgi:hypothetical protein
MHANGDNSVKKSTKKKALESLLEEINSEVVRKGEAEKMADHAVFIRALELNDARKTMCYQ